MKNLTQENPILKHQEKALSFPHLSFDNGSPFGHTISIYLIHLFSFKERNYLPSCYQTIDRIDQHNDTQSKEKANKTPITSLHNWGIVISRKNTGQYHNIINTING